MAVQDIPRERWLAHLDRVLALAEARKGRLDADELAGVARELGIGEADLAAAAQEAADHFARGQGFYARHLWNDAVAELTEAHTLAPTRLDISLALARAHQRRGRGDDHAIADRLARMALGWEPGNETAFAILADLDAARRARTLRRRGLALAGGAFAAVLALLSFRTDHDATDDPPAPPASAPAGPPPPNAAPVPAEPPSPPRTEAPPAPNPAPVTHDGDACLDGTVFVEGRGCIAEDIPITPGVGLAGVEVGVSTPHEVLAAFGDDCEVSRLPDGRIFHINYDFDETGQFNPKRRRNRTRPRSFDFGSDERLRQIYVGVYNRQLRTPGGLNTETSTLDDALREFGEYYEYQALTNLDSYRWPAQGIEVWVNRETRKVNSFMIVPVER